MKRSLIFCVGLIFISLMFINFSYAKIDPNTVAALWLFDEGKGDEINDTSGNENHGKFMGDLKWVDGKFGKALEFDGATSIIDCGKGESTDFMGKTNLSITAWVKSNVKNMASGMIVWKALGCSTWAQYGFGVGAIEAVSAPTNKLNFYYRKTNGDASEIVIDDSDIPIDEWVHVAGTYDGKELSLYMNGDLVATQDSDGTPWASQENVYIGGDAGCGIRYVWSGVMDELIIFNVTLPQDDVASLMRGYVGSMSISPQDRIAITWAEIKSE